MSPTPRDSAESAFAAAFRATPGTVGHAPGRVELLGNHTDYNGGLVLAAAINRFTAAVGRRVEGRMCRVVTNDLGSSDTFDIGTIERGPEGSWVNYVRGTVWAMNERFGPLASGFEMALAGDVPIGAGLSSSASLQASVALFLIREGLVNIGGHVELFDSLRMEIARTLQRSENEFVGVGSGLLDQFSVLFGRADHALLLDCRSLEFERVPLGDPAPAIVVCDSKTSRKLADGMYNIRRAECERIVSHFQTLHPDREISQLRDLSLDELREEWDLLDTIGRLRARHVLTENERVRQGAEALERGDVKTFGKLMTASHASSRDDFQNSSAELDALVDIAEQSPGFLGGKLSGAGWAGCTVNLVEQTQTEEFSREVRAKYSQRTGVAPTIHVCLAAEGARADPFPSR